MTTILLYGIDSILGIKVAQKLVDQDGVRLIGWGNRPPVMPLQTVDVLTARLSDDQIAKLIQAEGIDTVIRLDPASQISSDNDNTLLHQPDIRRTADAIMTYAANGVQRIVIHSSSLVYGANPVNPAFISEEQPLPAPAEEVSALSYGDLESFVSEMPDANPDLQVVTLRCAPLVGGGVWSPFASYLNQAMPATLLGYNPRVQVLHADDAAQAFVLAATSDAVGPFNLASSGSTTLERAIRLVGHMPLPLPELLLNVGASLRMNQKASGDWPFDQAFLRYACVVDTQRAGNELGWTAEYDIETALHELAAEQDAYDEYTLAEGALQAFLSRRSDV